MKLLVTMAVFLLANATVAQDVDSKERARMLSERSEEQGLAEPFRGVAIDGEISGDLFALKSTGVSTEPVRRAATAFLTSLSPKQRGRTEFNVDDDEWRKWMNQHFYVRQGVGFDEMNEAQRAAAFGMLSASLSADGLQLTRDIMRLNRTLGELNDNNIDEYNEWLYWITIMGEPSSDEPWGWQLDGHHVIINYFVLGDQVVMSPVFIGSEPVKAEAGKYAGIEIMQNEQNAGLAFMRSLSEEQRNVATVTSTKGGTNNIGEAFKDNIDVERVGISGSDLAADQQRQLLRLIRLYVGNMNDGHAAIKMDEVAAHMDDSWFAWIGGTNDDSVFYYRILSPVILIEFDHQRPVNLRHLYPPVPNRQHIHAVIRTPNGNDYGKDLLRQHLQQHAH